MRHAAKAGVALWLSAFGVGCSDTDTRDVEARENSARASIIEAREMLEGGDLDGARSALRKAATLEPLDPTPHILLARVHIRAGRLPAAALELEQAEKISRGDNWELKRQRVDLYTRLRQPKAAIGVWVELRKGGQLSDGEIHQLALLQARSGDAPAAYETLKEIFRKRPDDVNAKSAEAEVLLASGEEMLAVKLMDRLAAANPQSVPVRLLRTRYYVNSGRPELAEMELTRLPPEAKNEPAVVEHTALVLARLGRLEEAAKTLQPLLDADGKNPDILALMAETRFSQHDAEQAKALAQRALDERPDSARALYVLGRIQEDTGDIHQAMQTYGYATRSGSHSGLVLSRVWRIQKDRGQTMDAMETLERLLFTGEASLEEKVQLAELYSRTGNNVTRGRALIREAMQLEPKNARYKAILKTLEKRGAR